MTKLVGFYSASGTFVPEGSKTGEFINWSNRVFRCITNDDLKQGEFGMAVFEQKLKKSQVCASLGLDVNSGEKAVDDALCKLLNAEIQFTVGRSGDDIKVNGFRVVKP